MVKSPNYHIPASPRFKTWISRQHWSERIISFNASWFTATMSTGIIVQILTNFPYPAQWLRDLAYCFWVLTIAMFLFFCTLTAVRSICYPKLTLAIFQDFYQTSFVGAIPVSLDTIIAGTVIFYSDRPAAVLAAFGLYWVAVALSLLVGGPIVFFTFAYQEAPELASVNGVWLLSFIPCIVTATTGSVIIPFLPLHLQGFTIIVTFLIWCMGISMMMVILVIYFWRLTRHKLPIRDAIVSCFIPVGPPGLGAYCIHKLSIDTSDYITSRHFTLVLETSPASAQVSGQVATSIHWFGITVSLFLVAFSTFWMCQATLSVITCVPKRFNVGFWSFVFPNAVYSNAISLLAQDLDNEGLRGWAATMTVISLLLWCMCAAGTFWKGVWLGELFFPPGLEGWNERKALGMDIEQNGSEDSNNKLTNGAINYADADQSLDQTDARNGIERSPSSGEEAEMIGEDVVETTERNSRPDGTYDVFRSRGRRGDRGNSSLT